MSDIKTRLIIEGDATGQEKIEGMGAAVKSAAQSADELAPAAREAGDDLGNIGNAAEALEPKLTKVAAAIGGLFAAAKIKGYAQDVIAVVDAYGQYASRIEMATESAAEYEMVQRRLLNTANLTYRNLTEAQEVFIRTNAALKSLNYSTAEAVDITDSFSFQLTTNAASAEKGEAAMNAFSAAIQTGSVNAMQWRTILTAMPTIVDAISTATGKSAEEIRRLGVEGNLALEDLTEGLRQTVDANREATESMRTSVNDALTRVKNTFSVLVGEANLATGATDVLVGALDTLSNNLGTLVTVATLAGEATLAFFAAKAIPAVTAYGKTLAASIGSMRAAHAANTQALAAAQVQHARYQAALAAARIEVQRLEAAQISGGAAATAHAAQISAARARLQMFGASAAVSGKEVAALTAKTQSSALGIRKLFAAIPGPLKIALSLVGFELLAPTGRALGEFAAKIAGVDKAAQEADKANRERTQNQLISGRQLMDQYSRYSDVVVKSAADVARMSESERELYQQRLEGAREYWRGASRAQLAAQEMGVSFELTYQQVIDGINGARDGLDKFAAGLEMTRAELDDMLSVGASSLIAQFDTLINKVNQAGEKVNTVDSSLKEIAKTFQFDNVQGVQAFGQALAELQSQGKISAKDVGSAWEQALGKLDGEQLARFRLTAKAAFGDTKRDVEALDVAFDKSLRQSIAATGQDFTKLQTGIGKDATAAIGHLNNIAGGLDRLKKSGIDTGAALEEALNFALKAADSEKALALLEDKVRELSDSGNLSAEAVKRLGDEMAAARQRVEDLTPGIQSAEEAFRKLGVTSQEALQRAADAARESFDYIVKSGKASTQEIKAAFETWAQAAADAAAMTTNGMDAAVQGMIEATASANGLKVAFDESGKVAVQTYTEAADAAAKLRQETNKAASEAKKAAQNTQEVADSTKHVTVNVNEASKSISAMGQEWLTATNRASQYASEANQAIFEQIQAGQRSIETARQAANAYVQTLENLDRRQQSLTSSAAQGVADLQFEILELEGTEKQIANARLARDVEQRQREIALLQIEIERARIRGDSDEADRLQQEIMFLQQQIPLLEKKARLEREAAEQARKQQAADAKKEKQEKSSGGETSATAATRTSRTVNVNLNLGGNTYSVQADQNTAERLVRKLSDSSKVSA